MKSRKLVQFAEEFSNIDKMNIFEVQVIDKRTNEIDYIIFDISIQGRSFVAQHTGLSKKQDQSKKISFVKVTIDPDFSVDSNLEELYSECINAICESEYYELGE